MSLSLEVEPTNQINWWDSYAPVIITEEHLFVEPNDSTVVEMPVGESLVTSTLDYTDAQVIYDSNWETFKAAETMFYYAHIAACNGLDGHGGLNFTQDAFAFGQPVFMGGGFASLEEKHECHEKGCGGKMVNGRCNKCWKSHSH